MLIGDSCRVGIEKYAGGGHFIRRVRAFRFRLPHSLLFNHLVWSRARPGRCLGGELWQNRVLAVFSLRHTGRPEGRLAKADNGDLKQEYLVRQCVACPAGQAGQAGRPGGKLTTLAQDRMEHFLDWGTVGRLLTTL